ncbi:uncharacterized protein RSE6_14572 [Rhynchosporium secalis]|uniref:DUF6594 domain-containing protein n=1 Tax=Rhynchosporium secalis TaxID=38038 RepID=A0A1E1MVL3_RHYSE|nr:uncharacterized protein RSE6_14572 [Rhynchosporium secalis]
MSTPIPQTDLEMGDVIHVDVPVGDLARPTNVPDEVAVVEPAPETVPVALQEGIAAPAPAPAAAATNPRLTPEEYRKRIKDSELAKKWIFERRFRDVAHGLHLDNIERAIREILKHDTIRKVATIAANSPGLKPLQELYRPATALGIYDKSQTSEVEIRNLFRRRSITWKYLSDASVLEAILEVGQHGDSWDKAEILRLKFQIKVHNSKYKVNVLAVLGLVRAKAMANDAKNRDEKLKARKAEKEFRTRLYMAVFGGLALVAPILIMTLHEGKTTSQVTTSVFVFAVSIILAWRMKDAQAKDIIGATAAYPAVLVVFVGTITNTTGEKTTVS